MYKMFLAGTAAAALLAGTAFAQTQSDADPAAPAATPPAATDSTAPGSTAADSTMPDSGATDSAAPANDFVETQSTSEVLATNLIGKTVRNRDDEKIADVSDLVVDENRRVTAAVLGVGGFLGMGKKSVAVPIESLETVATPDGEVEVVMLMTREDLEEAPDFVDLRQQRAEEEAARAASQAPAPGGGIGMN